MIFWSIIIPSVNYWMIFRNKRNADFQNQFILNGIKYPTYRQLGTGTYHMQFEMPGLSEVASNNIISIRF